MKTRYNFPTRVLFGEGVVQDLVAELMALGVKRPVLVTDQGLTRTPLPGMVMDILKAGDLAAAIYDAVEPNPTDAQVDAGAKIYREHGGDSFVALGGGSPMDAAKAMQIRVNHHEPMEVYDDLLGGDAKITEALPPLIAIATTSGTGSEVSRSAVITIAAVARKVVLFHPDLMPRVAICDPELTYGLPAQVTAQTGMDALSHNLEAYLSPGYHPMADGIAIQAIAQVGRYLPVAVADPGNVEARREMMAASFMGAVAFQKGLGVIHSLAHALGAVHHIGHGVTNAILMPHAVRFNGAVVPERVEAIARALGFEDCSVEGCAKGIEALMAGIGIPKGLSALGVGDDKIALVVEKAMEDGCHGTNPRKCAPIDMETLFKAAL